MNWSAGISTSCTMTFHTMIAGEEPGGGVGWDGMWGRGCGGACCGGGGGPPCGANTRMACPSQPYSELHCFIFQYSLLPHERMLSLHVCAAAITRAWSRLRWARTPCHMLTHIDPPPLPPCTGTLPLVSPHGGRSAAPGRRAPARMRGARCLGARGCGEARRVRRRRRAGSGCSRGARRASTGAASCLLMTCSELVTLAAAAHSSYSCKLSWQACAARV